MAKQPPSDFQPSLPAPVPSRKSKSQNGIGPENKTEDEKTAAADRLQSIEYKPDSRRRQELANKKPNIETNGGIQKHYTDERGLPVLNLGRMVSRFDGESIAEADLESEQNFSDVINRNRHPLSSFLFSLIVHTSLLIAFALVAINWQNEDSGLGLIVEIDSTPTIDDSKFDRNSIEITPIETDEKSPLEKLAEDTAVDDSVSIPETNQSLFQNTTDESNPTQSETTASIAPHQSQPTGGGLQGRNAESRAELAAKRGATDASERAVELGIKWIVAHQHSDGSWRFFHHQGDCNGRCKNPGSQEFTTAATGLALMSILGAGYTHQSGPYQEQVKQGIDYLLKTMRVTRFGGNLSEGSMYAQGIATLALSEAYIMTKDAYLKKPLEQALDFIISAQHTEGGWRYTPNQPGDMTVTGWQLMALKSGQIAGIDPPSSVLSRTDAFIKSLANDGYNFGYQKQDDQTPATAAIGMLSRLYLGDARETGGMFAGAENLISRGPSRTDIYYNYYATLTLHHLHSQHFELWNEQMRDYLVRTQNKQGHQLGSWYFPDKHGKVGGRLYTTAMAVMILEVYYRYMPLYEEKTLLEKFVR